MILRLFACILISCIAADKAYAAAFSRMTKENTTERLKFIRDGLAGKLTSGEDKTQYFILLCQPQRAWSQAEKIKDESTKKRFQGTILALSAIPRFDDGAKDFPHRVLSSDKVEMRFKLDQAEIWADEPPDAAIGDECDYPLAALANRKALIDEAKKDFATADKKPTAANFSLIALESDLGLKPAKLDVATVSDFVRKNSESPYLARVQFFLDQQKFAEEQPTFEIRGQHAEVSPLDFESAELKPHRLELPWLLR